MLNGAAPWQSHVTRLKTVSNMLTVTTRTPASTSRRASRQLCPNEVRPYSSRMRSGSSEVEGIFAGDSSSSQSSSLVHESRPNGVEV